MSRSAKPQTYPSPGSTALQHLHDAPTALRGRLPETFVQDLWAGSTFRTSDLRSVRGEPIVIRSLGTLNTDGGPDFLGACLRIGETDWHGDVEIHVHSSQWQAHAHHADPRYDSVILHVCLSADATTGSLRRFDGSPLDELVLEPYLKDNVRSLLYGFYTNEESPFLCAGQLDRVPQPARRSWLQQLGRMRLLQKAAAVSQQLEAGLDEDTVFYRALFEALGYRPNAAPMQSVAERVPLRLLQDLCSEMVAIEALLLGTAGFLTPPPNGIPADSEEATYVASLNNRFRRLLRTYRLPVMLRTQWQFFRLRPANFPTIRLAQGAALSRKGALLASGPVDRLQQLLTGHQALTKLRAALSPPVSSFWRTHVRLERASPSGGCLGRSRADVIIMNAVLPSLFARAQRRRDLLLQTVILEFAQHLPVQANVVVRQYQTHGLTINNGLEAQGVYHLSKHYCVEARCQSCAIGQVLLSL